jgi:hypothetical protein
MGGKGAENNEKSGKAAKNGPEIAKNGQNWRVGGDGGAVLAFHRAGGVVFCAA